MASSENKNYEVTESEDSEVVTDSNHSDPDAERI